MIIKEYTKESIRGIIDNELDENQYLEFKEYTFENGKIKKKVMNSLLQEIVAFANANGGQIVIGISEDVKRHPDLIPGVEMAEDCFDNWVSSIRQAILACIRPHLHGVTFHPVKMDDDKMVIVITIPRSYSRPHSYWDGNQDIFYIRHSNGKTRMDIEDLRRQFLYTNVLQDKIVQFKKNRISKILNNEVFGNLTLEACLVIHIIPRWSFELGNIIDIKDLRYNTKFQPLSGNSYERGFNIDGYYVIDKQWQNKKAKSYAQIFHNGIIEANEIRLISGYEEKVVFDWNKTEKNIIDKIINYVDVLQELDVSKPFHIFATILNAKGYITRAYDFDDSNKLDRDIIESLDSVIYDEGIDSALKPVFDSLANAFGYEKSFAFDEDGKIKGE